MIRNSLFLCFLTVPKILGALMDKQAFIIKGTYT